MDCTVSKILYCTDLSQNAVYAFKHASYLAKMTNAEIHILHVVVELPSDAKVAIQSYMMSAKGRHDLLEAREETARAHLDKCHDDFFNDLPEEDQAVRKQIKSINVIEAYPAEQILKSSVKLGCDLIVMGAHEKGLTHTFLGSVAKSVLRRSRIPTLIVPLP
ncbi:universal stress protein [Terasakiella sp.]|uniref:universal stress protein n=1 Tax=Terasakiella sp. TaxID=2034861 RepID=UPI003AA98786